MEEGTFPVGPGGVMPKPQNPWETPTSPSPAQEFPGVVNSPQTSYVPPGPSSIVFRAKDAPAGNNSSLPPKHSSKKILKIIVGIFVFLAVLISIVSFFIIPRSSNKEKEQVTLTYWGLFEDEAVVRPVLAEFEKENPNIKIEYTKQDLTDYRERLTVRTENGNGPDIFRYHNTWYPMVSNILMPLPREVIEKNEFNERYYDVMSGDIIKNGSIYGIPLHTDTLSLFVNTTLFQQSATESGNAIPIPKTWQEFIDTSARLTKRDDTGAIVTAGAGIGTYDNVVHAPDIISLLLAQNGVDLTNPDAYKDKIADALRFYTNFSQVEDNVWDATQDNTQTTFAQGNLAMYFGYSWDLDTFKKTNPGLQIQIAPVPQLVTDERVNIASYWIEGANQKTKHPEATLLFMKFLARPDIQEKLYAEQAKSRAIGEPYSIKSLAPKLKDTDAFVFIDQSNTAVYSPFIAAASDKGIVDKYNNSLKETVNGMLSGDAEEDGVLKLLDGYSQATTEIFGSPEE